VSDGTGLPIDEWFAAAKVPRAEFVARYPYAVLVLSTEARPLQAVGGNLNATIDRLVLERMTISRPPSRSPYLVFPLVARPGARRVTVGCDPSCDVVIDDGSLSKKHAHVDVVADEWAVVDDDSSAGTRVNEQLLEPGVATPLVSGDRVTLGFVDLIFLAPADFWRLARAIG
jgi:hypothetical protein